MTCGISITFCKKQFNLVFMYLQQSSLLFCFPLASLLVLQPSLLYAFFFFLLTLNRCPPLSFDPLRMSAEYVAADLAQKVIKVPCLDDGVLTAACLVLDFSSAAVDGVNLQAER